jgi:hypothetical protein
MAMSRIVGDALVGGPETQRVPDVVTVRLTRGQAETLAIAAEELAETLNEDGFIGESLNLQIVVSAFRAQIGGSR